MYNNQIVLSNRMPECISEYMSDRMVDSMSEDMSDRLPDQMSDGRSAYFLETVGIYATVGNYRT